MVQYKHIKWTFLCRENDLCGHEVKDETLPHYHLEMRLNNRIFIKFNDFHFKFTDEDLVSLRCNEDPTCLIKQTFGPHGSGMEDAFSISVESIMDNMQITNDPSEAVYHIQTLVTDEKGIPSEIINEALMKSKENISKKAGSTNLTFSRKR